MREGEPRIMEPDVEAVPEFENLLFTGKGGGFAKGGGRGGGFAKGRGGSHKGKSSHKHNSSCCSCLFGGCCECLQYLLCCCNDEE